MGSCKNLKIAGEAWTDAAEADLAAALDDPLAGTEATARDVQSGRAFLFAVYDDQDCRAGSVACRIDEFPHGRDWVIVAAGGKLPGVNLTSVVLPFLMEAGKAMGAAYVRIHTGRVGLKRVLARRYGFEAVETVFRKELV